MAEFGNLPTTEPVVEKLDGKTVVTLGTVHFTEGNAAVRAALEDADVVELRETFAQRYLGCGMPWASASRFMACLATTWRATWMAVKSRSSAMLKTRLPTP